MAIYLPNGLGELLPNLKQLIVLSSKLKHIRRRCFKAMKALRDLRLDHNEIEVIFTDTFWDLRSLQWLSLSHNRLKVLPEGALQRLSKIAWLTLDHNKIETFRDESFPVESELEMITMKGNRLRYIKFGFKKYSKLKLVDFSDNVCLVSSAQWSQRDNLSFSGMQKRINDSCSGQEKILG